MSANDSLGRQALDAAAKILRHRAGPDSRFYALAEGIAESSSLSPFSEMGLPYTERLSRSGEPGQPQVGDMPPQPPTLRGRVGAVLVNIVRRMLFWYTDQIRAQHKRIAEAAREQVRALHDLSASAHRQREAVEKLDERLSRFEDDLAAAAGQVESIQRLAENLRMAQTTQADAMRVQQASVIDRLRELEHATASLQQVRAFSHAEDRPAPDKLAALFVEHARAFRGERAEIKRRLEVYVPYAQQAYAAAGNAPALDLGCGRGEWLERLAEAGIPARGVDANPGLVTQCGELNLQVVEGSLPGWLQALPDESYSIVSAIHVLEHLSFRHLLEIVDQAVRILRPGGIAIFETPNPRNLFVSSTNFYLDPTHHHPLPSEWLAFLVQARGLRAPEIIPLAPYPEAFRLPESGGPAAAFINEHFYGPQDYGIVARKFQLTSVAD